MKQKRLSKFVIALLVVVMLAISAFAATETVDGIKWTYTVSNGEASVGAGSSATAVTKATTGAITIPSMLGGYPVTSIEYKAFYGCSGLASVTIPDSVTSIGSYAFCNCSGLISMTIPDGVTYISEKVFCGCSSLTIVMIPDGVTRIEADAFSVCPSLASVTIPDSVTSIGAYAFDGCSGLTSVTIGNGVTSIGREAFCGCSGLTSVMIPDSVTSIGPSAFYGCSGLTSVTIPDSVMSIAGGAFRGCDSLADADGFIIVRNALHGYIGPEVSILIPNGVTSIGEYAFLNCSGIISVTIPDSVTYIDEGAFCRCSSLKSVTFLGDAPYVEPNLFYDTSKSMIIYVYDGTTGWVFGSSSMLPSLWPTSDVEYGRRIKFVENGGGSGGGDTPPAPITCTVTFNANGGSVSPTTRTVTKGAAVGALPTPTRSGYTFDGWLTAANGGTRVSATTVVSGNVTYYAQWKANGSGSSGGGDEPSIPTTYTVTYRPGASGTGSQQTATKTKDVALQLKGAIFTRTGYAQIGWATSDGGTKAYGLGASYSANAAIVLYPVWTVNQYTVTFNANGGMGGKTMTLNYGAKLTAPTVTRAGYTFTGWSPAVPATVPANNATYTAQWKKNLDPTPTLEPEEAHELYMEVDGAAPTAAASEYNGYLYDAKSGVVKGTIQVKVGKPNAKTGLATIKATVVIGTKKVALKGADKGKAAIEKDGPTELELVGGEACEIELGSEGLSGYYGAYEIDGARNFFTSKDKDELAAVNGILSKWQGSFMVIWGGGTLSVSVAAKGKVKVSGTLANGAKVTVNTALLVGEEWSCISVAAQKANLAFVLWLSHDGQTIKAEGLDGDVLVGKPGTLADGAKFRIDAAKFAVVFGQTMLPYLPDGVAVKQNGTKWTLPRAGKVAYKNGAVDETKLGENPCGLKLTYTAKSGTFKGSFKVYAVNGTKAKATTVNVTGFLLNGVGHGTATIKGKGGVAVEISSY